jgi:glycine dehydrogenase
MNTQQFVNRHISLNEADKAEMLNKIGVNSIDELISQTIPDSIRLEKDLELSEPLSEYEMLLHSKDLASKNVDFDTYIGFGYNNTILPSPIKGIFLKTRAGTQLIRLIRQRSHKVGWKRFLISRQ